MAEIMAIIRVDNRLVHGQVIETWLPYTDTKHLFVANDALKKDFLRQQIICLAIPQRVCVHFIEIQSVIEKIKLFKQEVIFILFETLQDLQSALYQDVHTLVEYINIGNLHASSQENRKKQIVPHIFVDNEQWEILEKLIQTYTLDFRSIPSERNRGWHELSY